MQQIRKRPFTARSVIASTLLGAHPPVLPARVLIRSGELFEIPEGTIRVALTRMLHKQEIAQYDDGRYALTGRLLLRQARQEEGRHPKLRRWNGAWRTALVTAVGRSPADRAALRETLRRLRLAELRDGVWVRPDNLPHPDDDDPPAGECLWASMQIAADPHGIVAILWDTKGWATEAEALLGQVARWRKQAPRMGKPALVTGFVLSAAVLRHFNADPLLPPELLPRDWPGTRLRKEYEAFDGEFLAMWRSFMG